MCRYSIKYNKLFTLICTLITIQTTISQSTQQIPAPFLTLQEFDKILDTESMSQFNYDQGDAQAEFYWQSSILYEWTKAIDYEEKDQLVYPFIICHTNRRLSGIQRRDQIMNALSLSNVKSPTMLSIYNEDDGSCFMLQLFSSQAKTVPNYMEAGYVTVTPMTYAMKMIAGTISETTAQGDEGYVDVSLCPGEYTTASATDGMTEAQVSQEIIELITSKDLYTGKTVAYENFFWFKLAELPGDHSNNPTVEFWTSQFENGIDSNTAVCNNIYDVLIFELTTSGLSDGDLATMSIRFDQLDLGGSKTLPAECIMSLVAATALLPQTCAVQTRYEYSQQNKQAQWLVQTHPGDDPGRSWYNQSISGNNQIVAVSDTGIDLNNCYFWDNSAAGQAFLQNGKLDLSQRKVVLYDNAVDNVDYNHGHGSHVAATICGRRAMDGVVESTGVADGVARSAKVAFIDIGTIDGRIIIPKYDKLLSTGRPNAKIHSASWGSKYNGYGIIARNFDSYMFDNSDFLVVTAAGNDGTGNKANSVGDPGTAKNALTVGASHSDGTDLTEFQRNYRYIAEFSSQGPTKDGRLKPDLVAPGSYILSAGARTSFQGECDPTDGSIPPPGGSEAGLLSMQGTSMATAVVSGTAALVRQYFEEGWYPSGTKVASHAYNPTSALMKAVLINGGQGMIAKDNGQQTLPVILPDNVQGHGVISLTDSLYLQASTSVEAVLYDREEVEDGRTRYFEGTMTYSDRCPYGKPLSVTLVWTDPPATAGCRSCVLNDLDLYLKTNTTQKRFYPNGLTTKDANNNVERIIVPASDLPDQEEFTIEVYGYNLVTRSQTFALAVAGCIGVPDAVLTEEAPPPVNGTPEDDPVRYYTLMSLYILGGLGFVCVCCGCIAELGRRRQ